MWLFALFIAVPLIEIALFIQVGGLIGLWPTLFIVLMTAVVGTSLMRSQGSYEMNRLRRSFGELSDPTEPLAHGAMILFAGALLLTPGFFTDAVGLSLLIPPVRAAVFRYVRARVKVQSFSMGSEHGRTQYREYSDDGVIDGEFTDVSPDKHPTHTIDRGPSGWTKH